MLGHHRPASSVSLAGKSWPAYSGNWIKYHFINYKGWKMSELVWIPSDNKILWIRACHHTRLWTYTLLFAQPTDSAELLTFTNMFSPSCTDSSLMTSVWAIPTATDPFTNQFYLDSLLTDICLISLTLACADPLPPSPYRSAHALVSISR